MSCEGEKTEPDYLDYLTDEFGDGDEGRPPFRIQPISRRNGMLPTETVEAVRRYADTDEAWVLFDRDGDDRDANIRRALKEAAAAKIEVGFSHPSFDLWLLLHFQPFSGAQSGSSRIVVEKLRSAKGAEAFEDYDKRNDKSVKGVRRDALRGKQETAVANARALVGSCGHGACKAGRAKAEPVGRDAAAEPLPQWSARSGHAPDCPALKRDPSTDVWRLLAALGIVPHIR
ncbi:RloB family protein [Streptomyces sp. RFCAC02]|uniref:RloB family protein n=1 Tax=Streptomyces sp. RFCAC02 TaxID=2499143 RepID=UPI00143D6B2D|nr:RloB family protein [Streptomyces sp. RFCAC02]